MTPWAAEDDGKGRQDLLRAATNVLRGGPQVADARTDTEGVEQQSLLVHRSSTGALPVPAASRRTATSTTSTTRLRLRHSATPIRHRRARGCARRTLTPPDHVGQADLDALDLAVAGLAAQVVPALQMLAMPVAEIALAVRPQRA
jgi:hypothetical protein